MKTFYDAVVEELEGDKYYKFVQMNGYIYLFYTYGSDNMNDRTLVGRYNSALDVLIGIALFAELHDLCCTDLIQQGNRFAVYLSNKLGY